MEVLESDNPERKPGSVMSWYRDFSWDGTLGDIKSYIAAATGASVEQVETAHAINSVGSSNPLKGTELRLSAWEKATKDGRAFCKVKFSPLAE